MRDPELFMVPGDQWKRYIQPNKRDKIICRECWEFIVQAIDTGKAENLHGVAFTR